MIAAPKPSFISRGFMGFSALVSCLSLANPASAGTLGVLSYEVRGGSVKITGCDEVKGEVVIPEKIAGRTVTEIGDQAFANHSEITAVILPSGVKRIGREAFSECLKLRTINLPAGLKILGVESFFRTDLRIVKIPDGVDTISNGAFTLCVRLHEVEIGKGVRVIGPGAFHGCFILPKIKIPEGVQVIGDGAFYYCPELESVLLPASITEVTPRTFYGALFKRIEVAPGNRRYSSVDGVLYNKKRTLLVSCPSRKTGTLKIPEGVTRLPEGAFSRCRDLKSVVLPDSLLIIEARAFYESSGLSATSLPDGLTSIGHHAFTATDLGDVTIPASVQHIDRYAFAGCGVKTVYFNGDAPAEMGEHVFDSNTRSNKPNDGFKIYFYEGKTGFTEPKWLGYDAESISPDAPVTNRLLFGAAWRN